jgi:hypothetical protein
VPFRVAAGFIGDVRSLDQAGGERAHEGRLLRLWFAMMTDKLRGDTKLTLTDVVARISMFALQYWYW